jgi:hypothetical protein
MRGSGSRQAISTSPPNGFGAGDDVLALRLAPFVRVGCKHIIEICSQAKY